MSVGIVILAHAHFQRVEAVARHWAAGGCPVVVHVDRKVPRRTFQAFRARLRDRPDIVAIQRRRCDWGGWGLVAATQDAAALMLARFDVAHVCLTSGACLPVRPVSEFLAFLDGHPGTDFIESAAIGDVDWTVDGLSEERFSLYFFVSWRRRRGLFDRLVEWQRALGVRRRMPRGLQPHVGSQWWCLTRETLNAILQSPDRAAHERFFRRTWIPDESYFQTLARVHSRDLKSQSLTLSRFDHQGRPHLFYDDHLGLLRQTDRFIARKIWHGADRLYAAFTGTPVASAFAVLPDPARIEAHFARADERRTRGRAGLMMQSRFPSPAFTGARTARPYLVLQGFDDLYAGAPRVIDGMDNITLHGHLFAPDRAHHAEGLPCLPGGLSDHAGLRDIDPAAFLRNLIWNGRAGMQGFLLGPADRIAILESIAGDAHAGVLAITGAWALPLSQLDAPFATLRAAAAHLHRTEAGMLRTLRARHARARLQTWDLMQAIADPAVPFGAALRAIGAGDRPHPDLRDTTGLQSFLTALQDDGMHPVLTGFRPALPPAAPETGRDDTRRAAQ